MSELKLDQLPGRLGNPNLELRDDPRADVRMIQAMDGLGTLDPLPPLPINEQSSIDELLSFCAEAELGYEQLNEATTHHLKPVSGVVRETTTIEGVDGNDITLYIHRPDDSMGLLPGVLHLHGGGMVLMSAAGPIYDRWRCELAASGLVVVGVEFRNGAGKLGPHPFPAGLNDCSSSFRWMADHRRELGISGVVLSGESGGGNLSLATCLAAKRDGRLEEVSGVYAQCPFISNRYLDKDPSLVSLFENDDLGLSCGLVGLLSKLYDPSGENQTNPLAWPLFANREELKGLPPHFISVCELDPLRDEGLAYTRNLIDAGVTASSRTINGVVHAADMIYRTQMPDVYLASVGDIKRFSDLVCIRA